jgi:tRNA (adenine22-N1)-methyltransferase
MASRRILALASLVPLTGPVVDIGSDHGQLIRTLYQQDFPYPLFASELTNTSFQTLKHALHDLPVTTYQADGLTRLPLGVNTVVISGMGGQLIQHILNKGINHLTNVTTVILGPQRDSYVVREWLMNHGWMLDHEQWLVEADQGYPLLRATRGTMMLTSMELHYGPKLIQAKDQAYCAWLKKEALTLSKQLTFSDNKEKQTRLEWIQHYVSNC